MRLNNYKALLSFISSKDRWPATTSVQFVKPLLLVPSMLQGICAPVRASHYQLHNHHAPDQPTQTLATVRTSVSIVVISSPGGLVFLSFLLCSTHSHFHSDLLSRHCNKCHANEKPPANTGSRRRGSASAARATTSKQACDQCVQSSLPCDGSNPCSTSSTTPF